MEEKNIVRSKAIGSHHDTAGLFFNRYEIMEKNSYANLFVYGRKKLFEKIFVFLTENVKYSASILDVGCGTGYFLKKLSAFGYTVVGTEPAVGMRQRALELNPGVRIEEATVAYLPYPDDEFDAVTAIEVFRYLDNNDRRNGYRECLRVLKPGGFLIITLVNKYALDGFILLYWYRLLKEKLFGVSIVSYCDATTPSEVKKYFKQEFNVEAETYACMFSPLRLIYKVNSKIGESFARSLEKFDENLSNKKWWQPFAGHLITVIKKS